jgi:hypothetical protein
MEVAQAKQGDLRIVASTIFDFPGPRDRATNPFWEVDQGAQLGVISVLERVETKITTLHSTVIPRCRKNEVYDSLPAPSAHLVTLYYAIMRCISCRKRSWCVQVLPPVNGSKIYIDNGRRQD